MKFCSQAVLNNRPIITEAWIAEFNSNEVVLKTVPLWVKLPNLSLNYWSKEALRLAVDSEDHYMQMTALQLLR